MERLPAQRGGVQGPLLNGRAGRGACCHRRHLFCVAGEFGVEGQSPNAERGCFPEHAELAWPFFPEFEVRGADFMSEGRGRVK